MDCSSTLFSVDFHGVLRTGRNITEEDVSVHVLKVGPCDNLHVHEPFLFFFVFLVFIVSQFILNIYSEHATQEKYCFQCSVAG